MKYKLRMTMKQLILSFFLILGLNATAQNFLVSGKVQQNKNTLKDVSLIVEGTSVNVKTDTSGSYSFQLPKGKYTLLATASGYLSQKISFEVKNTLQLPIIFLEKEKHETANNIITLSDDELDDEEGSSAMISGFLQSSQDLYFQRAAYDFSQVFYRPRGYDSNKANVLINGINMAKVETGRPQWSNWGGLNDATRNQVIVTGVGASENDFGGVFGSTSISVRPSEIRNGLKLSATGSNRSYIGRTMVTYNSGIKPNGFGYMISGSYRWNNGRNNWNYPVMDGMLYKSYAVAGVLEYKFSPYFSSNLAGIFSYNNRGKSAPLTQEAIALGGRRYNPNWGYQAGDIRNSKMKRIAEPIFILSNTYHKNDTKVELNLGYQFGQVGDTRLQYVKSQNPDPSYYTNMPTYYYNMYNPTEGGDPLAWDKAKQQIEYFRENKQLNWDKIYLANASAGGESLYALNEDIIDSKTLSGNLLASTKIHPNITLNGGVSYQNISTENYQQINDLLGGQYFLNRSYYSGELYDTQENLRLKEGDKYQYYYMANIQKLNAFGQLRFKFGKADFYVAGRYNYTGYERDGQFADNTIYADSKGKSGIKYYNTISTKAGITYSLTGRHILQFNTGYFEDPQPLNNIFVNIRNSNSTIPYGLKAETQLTADGSYIIRMPYIKARVTGYVTKFENATEKSYFFTQSRLGDESAGFVTQTMVDVNKIHFGGEFGAEVDVLPTIKATGVVSVNQYTYDNNPTIFQSIDKKLIGDPMVSYLKNYKVGNGPQCAYSAGLEYRSPRYWWVAVTANWFDRNYISVAPSIRTENIYTDPNTGTRITNVNENTVREMLSQEKLPTLFLMNLSAGKSWRIKGHFLNAFISVNNLLNNQFKSGGFEQARKGDYNSMLADKRNGYPTFGNKYFTGYGTTYYVNLALSL